MTKLDDLTQELTKAREKADGPAIASAKNYNREMNLGLRAFMEMLGVLLGSGLTGWALDAYFKTAPALMIVFIVLGIVAAFFNLYKLSKNLGTAVGSNGLQNTQKTAKKPPQK